jgi:hypothetical protein
MAIFDLFSKRQKRLRGEFPDVYQYEEIPLGFRNQIVHIIQDTVSTDVHGSYEAYKVYKHIHHVLSKEYGETSLKNKDSQEDKEAILSFFVTTHPSKSAMLNA